MADDITIVVNAQDNFSGVLGNFGSIMTGIESVVNLASQAFGFAKDVIGDFVNSASESEQATARLDGVLRATGGSVGLTSEQLQDMANSLQNVTRFSDETILNGEAILLTFRNIGGEMFERTVPAMADMAEIFGSVDSAAMQLGKALNDPLTGMGALSRAGITFSEDQKKAIQAFMDTNDIASAQNIILTEVENQVHGLAEAMGDTFSGKMEIFKNKLDTIKETIGGALLPILGDMLDGFMAFVDNPAIVSFFESLARNIAEFPTDPLFAITDTLYALGGALENLGIVGANDFLSNIGDAILAEDSINALGEVFVNWAMSIDWNKISDDLAAGIRNVDWAKLGAFISEAIGYGIMGLSVIIEGIDWQNVFNAIGEAFANFVAGFYGYANWDALAMDFGKGIEYSLVAGFGYVDFNGLKTDFVNGFRTIGQAIASAFGYYGWDAWNNLWDDFKRGWDYTLAKIKDLLGISSPSTVFRDIAKNLVQGLMDGWNTLFDSFLNLISSGIGAILDLFAPFLALFGIDVSTSGLGTAGGGVGTTGGGTGGGASGQVVNNYFYGTVYIGSSLDDANYDCPSPNPLVAASGNQLVATGF